VTSKQGPLGTASYTYDELNRVLTKNYSDTSTVRAVYAYDGYSSPFGASTQGPPAVGHLTGSWSVNHDGTVVAAEEFYNFDAMGRPQLGRQCTPATCGLSNYPVQTGYNLMGNEINLWDSSVVRYTQYDSTDRLLSFTSSFNVSPPALTATGPGNQNLLNVTQYGPVGMLTGTLGNGLTETRAYNSRTWLQSLGVGSVYSLGLTYAGNGNVLTSNDSENGNWTYQYDNVNRLQWAKLNGQYFNYYPDQYGNMYCTAPAGTTYSCTPTHGSNLPLSFNTTNNQISDGGIHQYDPAGNMTQDGTHGYVYDLENRLTCVLGTDGTCTSASAMNYFYDAAGQRVGKQQANTLEDYVYDPEGHIISVHDGSANLLRAEIYTGGRHLATLNPGANNGPLFYNFADWLGTERVRTTVINGTVTVAESCQDTPYGMNLTCATFPGIADSSPMHFTGKQRDYESGLDYFNARYNASQIGRFMTPDPFALSPLHIINPQRWNMYAYTLNNPTSFTDPTGLDAIAVTFSNMAVGLGHMGIISVHKDGSAQFAEYGPAGGSKPIWFGEHNTYSLNTKIQFGANGLPTDESNSQLVQEVASREHTAQSADSISLAYFKTSDLDTLALDQYIAWTSQGWSVPYAVGIHDCRDYCLEGLQAAHVNYSPKADLDLAPNFIFQFLAASADQTYRRPKEKVTSKICYPDKHGKMKCH